MAAIFLRITLVLTTIALMLCFVGAALGDEGKDIKKCFVSQNSDWSDHPPKTSSSLNKISDSPLRYASDTGAFTVEASQVGKDTDAQIVFILTNHNTSLNAQQRMSPDTRALYELKVDQRQDPEKKKPGSWQWFKKEDDFIYLTGLDSCRHVTDKDFSLKALSSVKVYTL